MLKIGLEPFKMCIFDEILFKMKDENNIGLTINKDVLQLLIKKELSIDQLVLLQLVYNNRPDLMEEYFSVEKNLDAFTLIRELEVLGYLNRDEETLKLSLTGFGLSFIDKYINIAPVVTTAPIDAIVEPFEEAVEEKDDLFTKLCGDYVTLFKKQNTGISGKSCRIPEIIPKMKKFVKEFPSYSHETILKCTAQYIEQQKNAGSSKYIIEAGYFLYKRRDGTKESEFSKLGALLEDFKEEETNKGLQNGEVLI